MTLTMPKGVAGFLAARFDLDLFPLRRRVRHPKIQRKWAEQNSCGPIELLTRVENHL